jgi:hypothetical protein
MTPVFRASQIVLEINRHLRVFGHRISRLVTDSGKELGSRGARRWRPGTGSRFANCVHCHVRLEAFLFHSGSGDGISNMFWVSKVEKVYRPGGYITRFFQIKETSSGFALDEPYAKLLERRQKYPEILVCTRIAAFL